MDPVFLARLQFGLTVGFHYIFPVITIGTAWLIAWMLWRYLRTGDEAWGRTARFWIRVFAVTFVVGVATGITMEFQFGTNWAHYSRFVGDIFGAPLAAEGVFAFFLESTFMGVLLFGERRVSRGVYAFSGLMVAVGSTLSGFWIVVANSWQQTPAGYEIIDGKARLTSFGEAVFNPSTVPRYLHTIDGALIAGAFFVLGLSAWFLLKKRHVEFAQRSIRVGLVAGVVASALQWPLGHYHAVQVAETQPVKLAAFEGIWETTDRAPLLIFGIPNVAEQRTDFKVAWPNMLSIGVGGSADTVVQGLEDFPEDEWPPIMVPFGSFHVMVGFGVYFVCFTGVGLLLLWRKRLVDNRWFLKLAVLSIPLPIIANELGWIAAEVGRQPWVVQGLLRTEDAASKMVPAGQILATIVGFSLVYAALFAVWIFLLARKMRRGPEEPGATTSDTQTGEVY